MTGTLDSSQVLEPEILRARRPKALTLTLLGVLTHEKPIEISTGTFLTVLSRLGISSHATRSTLSRLVDQGLLLRDRRGRETYYTLTAGGSRYLHEGNALVWQQHAATWDGVWTLLSYSIPEERRALRLRLRSRLTWGGFGMLRSGLWIAPRRITVTDLLKDLDVVDQVHVFFGSPDPSAETSELIAEAYDADEIANRYRRFVTRWRGGMPPGYSDALSAFLVLRSEWQQLIGADPQLPADHLPTDWPAAEAEQLFRTLYQRWEASATAIGREVAGLPDFDERLDAPRRCPDTGRD